MRTAASGRLSAITTDRLTLFPWTIEVARASLEDRARLSGILEVRIPDGWPSTELRGALPVYISQLKRDRSTLGWGLWMMVDAAEGALVGDVGFKGKPDAFGMVEIGYGVAPEFRNRGYATEGAEALVAWAGSDPDVSVITAECLETNVASVRVLEKIGLAATSRDGAMLKWERRVRL